MQIRVSEETRALLDAATTVSIRHGKCYVGIEHLYDAVLDQTESLPASVVDPHLRTLRRAGQIVRDEACQGASPAITGDVYYTPRCGAAVNEAARLAERLHSPKTTAAHVLLAILADAHSAPSRAMDRLGDERPQIIGRLRKELSGKSKTRESAAVGAGASSQGEEPSAAGEVPSLENLTRNLTREAAEGRLTEAVGRDTEIMQLLEILSRQGKHNAILVGDAGVGKTRIVEQLAVMTAQERVTPVLGHKRIVELNLSALMSGTQYRGAFEEKVSGLLKRLADDPDTILFIDEIHLIMGAGATDGDRMDLGNLLKPALGRGELRCIGATTLGEYRKFIARDPAIERRFQMVRVEPLSPEATLSVLESLRPSLERHHAVRIVPECLESVIALTQRYLPNRHLPDKAIDVLDQACARFRINRMMDSQSGGKRRKSGRWPSEVTPHDVRKIVSQVAAIPLDEITSDERKRLTDLDQRLKRAIVGQDEAVAKTAMAVKKSRAGMADPERPDAVMLFLGPTGVGKTELAKELARQVFGSKDHLLTFDMSEFVEAHSVSRLIGAPPGYVGSEEEGLLTAAVMDNPYSILLFDEIEKAHPQVYDILLPVLDEGRLKDSLGRIVSFRNCIIIFTSNVGAELLGAGEQDETSSELLDALRNHFRPEFINRIDEIVPFYPLLFEDIREIVRSFIDNLRLRLRDKGVGIRMYQRAYELLAEEGYSREFGARELRRVVERRVANPISELLLEGRYGRGDMIDVLMEGGKLTFRKGEPHTKSKARVS